MTQREEPQCENRDICHDGARADTAGIQKVVRRPAAEIVEARSTRDLTFAKVRDWRYDLRFIRLTVRLKCTSGGVSQTCATLVS